MHRRDTIAGSEPTHPEDHPSSPNSPVDPDKVTTPQWTWLDNLQEDPAGPELTLIRTGASRFAPGSSLLFVLSLDLSPSVRLSTPLYLLLCLTAFLFPCLSKFKK